MKKRLLFFLFLTGVYHVAFSQRVFISEEAAGRIRVGNLSTSGISTVTNFVGSLGSPRQVVVDQVNGRLYYLESYYEMHAASLSTGALQSVLITTGAMDELGDISYSDNAGGIYMANSSEVQGLRFIPWDNNDSNNDYRINIGSFDNDVLSSVAVDDGSEFVYFANTNDGNVYRTGFAGGGADLIGSFVYPIHLAWDYRNNFLYILDYTGSQNLIYRYNANTSALTLLYTLANGNITDMQVYPGYGEIYYALANNGIYSVDTSGADTPALMLSLAGSGDIFFSIEADLISPVFTALSPTDNSTNVSTTPVMTMTFDENMAISTTAGTAAETSIRIVRTSDSFTQVTLDRSAANISIANNVVTLNNITGLEPNTAYHVLVGNKVFRDLSQNDFVGISLSTGWNFQTVPGVILNLPTSVACVGTNKTYPAITITEANAGNFKVGASQSLRFGWSTTGYIFENTTGTVSSSGSDLTITSFSISNSLITINYNITGTASIDAITISGLKVNSNSASNPTATIIRTAGTGVVDGLALNTIIGTVPTQDQPPAPGIDFPNGNNICLNGDASAATVTATGTFIRWFTANNLLPASFMTSLNDMNTLSAEDLGISSASTGTVSRFVRQNVGGCISLATQVDFVVVDPPLAAAVTIVPQTSCSSPNGSIEINDVDGEPIANFTFDWLDASMNPLGQTANLITGLAAGNYNVRVTKTATNCEAVLAYTVPEARELPAATFAVTPNTHCETPNGSVTATITNQSGPITDYVFTWYDGPDTGSPVNGSSTGPTLSGLSPGAKTATIRHTPTGCEGTATTTMTENLIFPTPAAVPSSIVCESAPGSGTANVNLVSYNSTLTGGDGDLAVTWNDPSLNVVTNAVVADNDNYSWILRRNSNGCEFSDNFIFDVTPAPTTANAGADQNICGAATTLAANTPSVGTGAWTVLSGSGGTIGTPASPASAFSGVANTTYVLRWTTSNGAVCTPSTDDVTIVFTGLPTTANAGPDQSVCNAPLILAGNTPVIGTGQWSVVSGTGGSFNNTASPTAQFSGTAGTAYTLRWTITGCTSTTDDVIITIAAPPTASAAGPDQSVCGTSTTLAANTPAVGTGLWAIISGAGGSLIAPSSPSSGFSGTIGTTYTLRWTITSTGCTASTDDVIVLFNGTPTAANAGTDKNICGTTVAMTGNTPTVGAGAWSIVSGTGGSFGTPSSPSSSFTGTAGNTYTLRWTISNGGCTPATDDVTVALVASPTAANAGPDQSVCGASATLAANAPSVGTGTWSVVSGAGGSFSNPASPSSAFNGTGGVTYTLRWTTSNGICTASTDDVQISLVVPPSTAQAGVDQSICGNGTDLIATAPTSGTGSWSLISGAGGSIGNPALAVSGFTGVAGTTYTLRWTVSKPGCTSSSDDVTVQFKAFPQGTGNLQSVTICNEETATMTVSGYTNVQSFSWSVPAGFESNASTTASAQVTALAAGTGTVTVIPRNECGDGNPASASVTALPLPEVVIALPERAFPNDDVLFTFTSFEPVATAAWTFGDGASSTEPIATHAYAQEGNFEVTLSVTSGAGCTYVASETFTVSGEPDLTDRAIKNVITANGDDKNRVLFIEDLDRHPENEVRFLDRWGVELFSKKNYQNDWEAIGKDGQYLPAGQYMCIVKLNKSGKVISRTVSIIKGR